MNLKDVRTADSFARGVKLKMLLTGTAGAGKTPVSANTSPNPFILATEPGIMSLRGCKAATYCAYSTAAIEDFFSWWHGSDESKRFDTLIVDSATQMAEIYLEDALSGKSAGGKKRHGQEAYGDMARWTMGHMLRLYFQTDRHLIAIAKQKPVDENGVTVYRPIFPGQDLNVRIPHLFDLIACLGDYDIPGVGRTKAFRCQPSFDVIARDRSGRLAEFEPPNISALIKKMFSD